MIKRRRKCSITCLEYQYDLLCFSSISRVHISESTLLNLGNEFEVEIGNGHERDSYIAKLGIKTYFIVPREVDNSQNQLLMK